MTRSDLMKAIVITAEYYGRNLSPMTIEAMADDLRSIPIDTAIGAYVAWRRVPMNRHMPMPSDILAIINPTAAPKDLARETALRIRSAITKFGWCNSAEAKEYVGDIGWGVVDQFGGWLHLCECLGSEIQETMFMAQCRDAVESSINLGAAGFDPCRPALEQSRERRSGLTPIGEVIKAIQPPKENK